MSREIFKSSYGYDLATYEWIPEGEINFLVYLLHGYAEYLHKFYLVSVKLELLSFNNFASH